MRLIVRVLCSGVLAVVLAVGVPTARPDTTTAAAATAPATVATPSVTATASAAAKKLDRRCTTKARVLCVDKTRRKLYFVRSGRVVKTMDARFGCPGMRTREGTFKVKRKSRHHVSSIYHTKMPLAMFFSGGQAVHYSPDFARRGYNGCSHGCVNIRDRKTLTWVYNRVRVGDRVVVYRS